MGRITDEDIQRTRDATDVVSLISERIVLKPKGRLYWGLCPFHGEKTPSFKVDPATQLWHCFGCGLGGDAFGFVMRTDNVEFPDAVRILADRANVEIHEAEGGVPRGHKERLYAALDEAAEFYHRILTRDSSAAAKNAREYLGKRGFGTEIAKAWTLGYAPGRGALVRHLTAAGYTGSELVDANLALKSDSGSLKDRFYERVMFPIRDLQGRVVAFGGRVIGTGEPKYLNTNDTPVFHKSANMYGIERAKAKITSSGTAIVVEGYTDVIALHEAGVTNAVAALGTALTKQHVKLLGRFAKRVVCLFDGDEAGLRAADRVVEFVDKGVTPEAGASRVELAVAIIPDKLDPADFVAQRGVEAMAKVVVGAEPLLRFAINRRLARWDLDVPEERARALNDAAEVLAPIKDSLLADDYSNYIADKLFADFATVRRVVSHARPAAVGPAEEPAGTLAPVPPPTTPEARAALDLLALMVARPVSRVRARELLTDSVLTEPAHVEMAKVIATHGESISPAELTGRLEGAVPGAAAALSGATPVPDGEEEAGAVERDLVRRIKEFAYQRRIAVGKARLKAPEVVKDTALYDEVFTEVVTLQRALDSLRRGIDETN